ncbi:MAG: ABC transporter permease [Pseudomonadota bacterium]|jgi:ABC-2 type transport system permease protein
MSNLNVFSWHRVWAVMVRNWYGTIRSFDRLTESFYWIAMDLVLWGITASYVQNQMATGGEAVFFTIIAGVIMWSAVHRAQGDIGMGLLDELWNKNMINLFATPLKFSEWILALLLFSLLKAIASVGFGCLVAWVLYNFSITAGLSWYLIPLFIVLVLNGWWVGLLIQAIIMRLTTKAQALSWTFVWVLAPFSVAYFPLTTLPPDLQKLAKLFPTSYVFEEMRGVLAGHPPQWSILVLALAITLFYICVSLYLVTRSFRSALNRGLAKMY